MRSAPGSAANNPRRRRLAPLHHRFGFQIAAAVPALLALGLFAFHDHASAQQPKDDGASQSSNPMAADSPAADPEAVAHFERVIRPILAQHCYECHSAEADTVEGDLRVDRRDGLLRGGDRGPAIVPSDSAASLLMKAVRYEDPELEMPPSGRLPDETVRLLSRWIEDGAAMPTDRTTAEARKSAIDYEAGRQFWSFQPLRRIVGNGAVLPE
ncbi:MAG: hypothetical protein KDA59_22025, partial [Planctomycetales bacterium]|nr:hypothetical protein [Planctomycetales bacterium]